MTAWAYGMLPRRRDACQISERPYNTKCNLDEQIRSYDICIFFISRLILSTWFFCRCITINNFQPMCMYSVCQTANQGFWWYNRNIPWKYGRSLQSRQNEWGGVSNSRRLDYLLNGLFRRRPKTLKWRHNGRVGISNHQPHDCLLNRSLRRRSKKTSKLCVTGLCAGSHRWPVNSRTKGQKRGKCSIWWCHHGKQQRSASLCPVLLSRCVARRNLLRHEGVCATSQLNASY